MLLAVKNNCNSAVYFTKLNLHGCSFVFPIQWIGCGVVLQLQPCSVLPGAGEDGGVALVSQRVPLPSAAGRLGAAWPRASVCLPTRRELPLLHTDLVTKREPPCAALRCAAPREGPGGKVPGNARFWTCPPVGSHRRSLPWREGSLWRVRRAAACVSVSGLAILKPFDVPASPAQQCRLRSCQLHPGSSTKWPERPKPSAFQINPALGLASAVVWPVQGCGCCGGDRGGSGGSQNHRITEW